MGVARPLRLVVLFCREKAGWPMGIFPRAFSDIPLNCRGTDSSMEDAIDALLEAPDWGCSGDPGIGGCWFSSASESSSSSSPMAKALFSSGTSLKVGVRAKVGLRRLSIELFLEISSPTSLRCWF
jgi:hypothetical protein